MPHRGEQFLHQKDPRLHTTQPVEHEQARKNRRGEKTTQKPADKLADWLQVIEKTHMGHKEDPQVLDRIKQYYHKEYVTITKDDIPQSYWDTQGAIACNEGKKQDLLHAGVTIEEVPIIDSERNKSTKKVFTYPDNLKEQKKEIIKNNQERSLDKWIDYLTSEDATYPAWAKYWAFRSITKMGKVEKVSTCTYCGSTLLPHATLCTACKAALRTPEDTTEKARFSKRNKHTVASFPTLNPRALAMTIGAIRSKVDEKQKPKKDRDSIENISSNLSDDEFKSLLSTEDFSRLYAQFLVEMPVYTIEGLKETRGAWTMYPKGADPAKLVNSLEKYPLGWCTADFETAKKQLEGGDFHVYYSINKDGEAVIPRLAIRMKDGRIAEPPRGIAPNQNLDPYINLEKDGEKGVLDKKLEEFGQEADAFKKRSADMKQLTEIEQRNSKGEELTTEDLRFVYEIDAPIKGFGYQRDLRIEEIKEGRDVKTDLSQITGFPVEQISITQEEALRGGIMFHYGSLNLKTLTSAKGLTLPKIVKGTLYLGKLTSVERLQFPETLNGGLYLSSVASVEGLQFSETMLGSLFLNNLTSAAGVIFPKILRGDLNLNSLTSANGVKFPEIIDGDLELDSLTFAAGVNFPKNIGGSVYLKSLPESEKEQLRKQYPQFSIH